MKFADMRNISAEFLTAARKPQAATANIRGFLRLPLLFCKLLVEVVKVLSNKCYPRREHTYAQPVKLISRRRDREAERIASPSRPIIPHPSSSLLYPY